MTEGLFLLDQDSKPKRLAPAEFKTEDEFQRLLAQFPELLTDADFGEASPRKWLLVTREAMVPDAEDGSGRWSLDHLFLDQDGIPTLVEMKRASDTRARREVAAQMLDYAANATRWWTAEKIAEWLERRCQSENLDSLAQLRERLGLSEAEVASYWGRVRANLGSKTIRLIFVADKIERELAAIVEFLNEQMRSVTVVALELSLFSNGSERILSPRLIGLTADAVGQKSIASSFPESVDDWLDAVPERSAVPTLRRFIGLMTALGVRARTTRGSIAFDVDIGDRNITPVYLRANGRIALPLGTLMRTAAYQDEAARRLLTDHLRSAGFSLSTSTLDGEPSFNAPPIERGERWDTLRDLLADLTRQLKPPALVEHT
jgi:hypothetical protein